MDSYYRDHRVIAGETTRPSFDEARMLLTFDNADGCEGVDCSDERCSCPSELTVPAVFEICQTCDGRGSHVNPSIDSHGLSADDFGEDPDFGESYFRGDYDQPCNECSGRRVVAVPARESIETGGNEAAKKALRLFDSRLDSEAAFARECAQERAMGY